MCTLLRPAAKESSERCTHLHVNPQERVGLPEMSQTMVYANLKRQALFPSIPFERVYTRRDASSVILLYLPSRLTVMQNIQHSSTPIFLSHLLGPRIHAREDNVVVSSPCDTSARLSHMSLGRVAQRTLGLSLLAISRLRSAAAPFRHALSWSKLDLVSHSCDRRIASEWFQDLIG